MAKSIHKYLFYTLIAVVYGVFFSVESFYNFEGHSEAKTILAHAALHSSRDQGISTSSSRSPSTHSPRLNKRYQQENYIPCPIFRVGTPVRVIEPRISVPYAVSPLPLVTIDHTLLRGPPSVV